MKSQSNEFKRNYFTNTRALFSRYIMIAHHGLYSKVYKKYWIAFMILFCWIFSYGMQVPTLLGIWGKTECTYIYLRLQIQIHEYQALSPVSIPFSYPSGKFDYDPNLETCSIVKDNRGHTSKTFLFVMGFVIPCLVIVGCYTKIFWVVHR